MTAPGSHSFHAPVWDRGEPIDGEMLRFTIGDDWLQDQRLVEVDIRGSRAHARGLERVGILDSIDAAAIDDGLAGLLEDWREGKWNVESGDEDVHSAIERRLVARIGKAGKRLHTGRSRNDQVAVDMRLWLRDAAGTVRALLEEVIAAAQRFEAEHGSLPLPGYTHLRRAMPSSLGLWIRAHVAAFELDLLDLQALRPRLARCPLGSGAGYGVPLQLDREGVAHELGFDGPEEPVTLTQNQRGRAELSYLNALEALALDLGKWAADLWLYSTQEFGFLTLPVALTTGSSLMPHKRNPDLVELLRAQARGVISDRAALLDTLRDLPSGYHRDFQLVKPPLFRAHDRVIGALPLVVKLLDGIAPNPESLELANRDEDLRVTERTLRRAARGEAFRDVYREESEGAAGP